MNSNTLSSQRVVFSIPEEIVARFNSLYPAKKRSDLVRDFMRDKIEENEQEMVRAALLIENDSDYAALREVTDDMFALSGDFDVD
jgi:metal-responsive CopG/Arc/MetJ family transcriptional regulator